MRPVIALACLVILLAALKAAAGIVVPLLLAVTLAIAFQPVATWLARRGWPSYVAALATILGVLFVCAGAGLILWRAGADLATSLPEYQQRADAVKVDVSQWLAAHGLQRSATSVARMEASNLAQGALTWGALSLGSFLSMLFVVLVMAAFIQLEASSYRRKFNRVFGNPRPMWRAARALHEVQRFLLAQVVLATLNGVILGLWCWAWGVSSPLLWGVVAFLLNFVPVVGSVIAAVPPVLLGLVDGGLGMAAGVLSGYLVVNLVVDNILAPRIMGHAVGLSPLVVLLAMLVWGFVLGPVGALLSIPLTLTVKILLEQNEELRWLALVMGDPAETEAPALTSPNLMTPSDESSSELSG